MNDLTHKPKQISLTRDETFTALKLISLIADAKIPAPTRLVSPLALAVRLSLSKNFREAPHKWGSSICKEAKQILADYKQMMETK